MPVVLYELWAVDRQVIRRLVPLLMIDVLDYVDEEDARLGPVRAHARRARQSCSQGSDQGKLADLSTSKPAPRGKELRT